LIPATELRAGLVIDLDGVRYRVVDAETKGMCIAVDCVGEQLAVVRLPEWVDFSADPGSRSRYFRSISGLLR
jgi:hypothetical protein